MDVLLEKKMKTYKLLKTLFIIFIFLAIALVIGMIITYIVANAKVDAVIASGEKLSTVEQKELFKSLIKVPMTVLTIFLLVSIIGIFLFKMFSAKALKKQYEVEYEMKDSINN